VDRCGGCVEVARTFIDRAKYPGKRPALMAVDDERALAQAGAKSPLVLVSGLERHPNPMAALIAASEIAAPGGVVLITAAERPTPMDEASALHRFRAHELNSLISNLRRLQLVSPSTSGSPNGMLMAIAKPASEARLAHFRTPVVATRAVG
jgi:hypothetical protein